MKFSTVLKAVLIVAALALAISLAACVPQSDITDDFLTSLPDASQPDSDVSGEVSDEVSEVPEGYAAPPVIVDVVNVTPQMLVITGTCDEGCDVTITDGINDVTVKSLEGHFVVNYTINTTKFIVLSATAGSETLKTSEITPFRVEYKSTAMKRIDGLGVSVGSDSHFYYDTDLAYYVGQINELNGTKTSTLLTQTQVKEFKRQVNNKVANLRKRAGNDIVDVVYVLIPNSVTINPEFLAEGTEQVNYKTRYEQVVEALAETNAVTIDMSDTFLRAKEAGEKVYYDTDSHLTEYGGYLVYKAICDLMENDGFTDAAARDIDKDFTSSEVVFNGGNTAKNLGISTSVITEKATVYKPKFTLRVGKEDEKMTTGSGYISDFKKYDSSESMVLSSGLGTFSQRLLFTSNRKTLPCALIYRDDMSCTFADILAERFNRVLLAQVGDFMVNNTDAQRYYGFDAKGNAKFTVDYIFIIVGESNLGGILG